MQLGGGGLMAFSAVGEDLVGSGVLIEQTPCSVESMGGNEQGKGQGEENWRGGGGRRLCPGEVTPGDWSQGLSV